VVTPAGFEPATSRFRGYPPLADAVQSWLLRF